MTTQPPIPIPRSQRWREFRIKLLPSLVFLGVALLCAYLWSDAVAHGGFMGVGEGVRSVVTSIQPGILGPLQAKPYEFVTAGQTLMEVRPYDPRTALDLLNSDVQIARLQWQTTANEDYAFNADRILLEIHRLRTERAVAQVNLARAENDVRRNQPLFAEKLVTEEIYDLSAKSRDVYRVEIETKDQAIRSLEARLQELAAQGEAADSGGHVRKKERIDRLQASLNSATNLLAPTVLTAPIAGMISAVYRQPGESVLAGEPLLLINSEWSKRVIGYLRQPYPIQPEIGQPVRVLTQERKPRQILGILVQIGVHMESITNTLAIVPQGKLVDAGLPLVVELPLDAQIRPGEIVSLALLPRNANTTSLPNRGKLAQAALRTPMVASPALLPDKNRL